MATLEDTAFKTRYERGPPGSGWKLRRNEIAAICELATGAPAPGCVTMAVVAKPKPARCEDCFFHQNLLCALDLRAPCTTFRPAERGLAPERQLAFVFRTERITAAYAFPQPRT